MVSNGGEGSSKDLYVVDTSTDTLPSLIPVQAAPQEMAASSAAKISPASDSTRFSNEEESWLVNL